jgi:acyl-CoA synthetase (AMP-forming)/AMP-acid ligase II
MDTGRSRNATDVLHIHGYPSQNALAAAACGLMFIERYGRVFPTQRDSHLARATSRTALLLSSKISTSVMPRSRSRSTARRTPLIGLGVAKGDRDGLFLPNIPEFAVAYLALEKVGAIAAYEVPRKVEFVEALPKNATGKILQRVLCDQASTILVAG